MGLHNLRGIMSRLVDGGCERHRPVALIQSGTRVSQRTVTGTVETIADLADRCKFRTPTVIVVGAVVNLGQELQWFHETLFDYQASRDEVMKNSVELQVL
jgi:uroporphyrin-III C-methyltransferase